MKALLLAAGKGTRLGSLTEHIPKPLLEVRGTPVLRHLAALCARHGVDELCINTHYLADRIRVVMGNGSDFGLRIRYSFEEELLGTAGALHHFRDVLRDDTFFVLYGDNFMDYDLGALAAFHRAKGGIGTVALYEKEDVRHSGIAVLDAHARITRFIEKPAPEQRVSRLVNCGLYVLEPDIFSFLPDGPSDFGKDVFPSLLAQGKELYGMVMDHPLIAIDTVEMYRDAVGSDASDHEESEIPGRDASDVGESRILGQHASDREESEILGQHASDVGESRILGQHASDHEESEILGRDASDREESRILGQYASDNEESENLVSDASDREESEILGRDAGEAKSATGGSDMPSKVQNFGQNGTDGPFRSQNMDSSGRRNDDAEK
ncbi:MAG: nucleotidyltransferase family protein [Bacteroidetes bacterium]|nr:nucleotidyltransferase family protein [Bacteroidota bacterium]